MLSRHIDLWESKRECAVGRKRRKGREADQSKECPIPKVTGVIVSCSVGDISVMLYSSLWHFKWIKASNNYADWKDGGRDDTLRANTLMNNAAISLSLCLVHSFALSISSQFLSISRRWPLRLIVTGWELGLCPPMFFSMREHLKSFNGRLMCFEAAYMKLPRIKINNLMLLE